MTTGTIQALSDKAHECFVSGDWAESEMLYKQIFEKLDSDQDQETTRAKVNVLMDFSKLLFLKERNEECKDALEEAIRFFEADGQDVENHITALIRIAETMSFFEDMAETMGYLDRALKLASERDNPNDEQMALILSTQAAFILSNENQSRFDEADDLIKKSIEILSDAGIKSGDTLANVLSTKAICIQLKGDVVESQKYYLDALAAIEEEPLSPSFGEACFGYATLRATDSRFSESLQFLEEKITSIEEKIGKNHPILKRAISALALTYSACGELDEAEVQAQRYNQIVEMMGNPGPELKIDCLRILIDILEQQSRFREAQALLTRANDIASACGNESIMVRLWMDLARLKLDLGEFKEACELYERSLDLTRKLKGEDHFESAICLGLLGNAYFANQDFKKAEEAIRKSITLASKQEEFFGNLLGADNYRYLGLVCLQQNKQEEAEDAFLKALATLEATNMAETLQTAETLKNMGELYEVKNELPQAKTHFEKALKLARKILGDMNFEVADYISYLADIARKQKDYDEAEKLFSEALTIFENTLGPLHPRTCAIYQRFGEVSIEKESFDQAESYFTKALNGMEQTLGTNHPDVGYTSYCLGATFHWKEMPQKAEKYYRKALAVKESQLGKKHRDLAMVIEPLIDVLKSQGKESEANGFNRRMIEITGYDDPGKHEHEL